jgi:hypothetical protein
MLVRKTCVRGPYVLRTDNATAWAIPVTAEKSAEQSEALDKQCSEGHRAGGEGPDRGPGT